MKTLKENWLRDDASIKGYLENTDNMPYYSLEYENYNKIRNNLLDEYGDLEVYF